MLEPQNLSQGLLPASDDAPRPPNPSSSNERAKRKLMVGAMLCTAFMLTEIVGGVVCGSLAIITDAAHMLSDVAG